MPQAAAICLRRLPGACLSLQGRDGNWARFRFPFGKAAIGEGKLTRDVIRTEGLKSVIESCVYVQFSGPQSLTVWLQ